MGDRDRTREEMLRGHANIAPTASEVRKFKGIWKCQLPLKGIWRMEYLVNQLRLKGNFP